jgi:hypothetical protein
MELLLNDFKGVIENRAAAIDAAAAAVQFALQGSSIEDEKILIVDTAENRYVSADVGLAYAETIGEASMYAGANLYMRPVNKDVPLSQRGGFFRRFAFTVGLSLQSIADKRGTRDDLFLDQALVLGVGYRISQYLRAGGGALVFWERDPDTFPLTRTQSTAVTPYAAISFDIGVGDQLKGVGSLFDFLHGKRDN